MGQKHGTMKRRVVNGARGIMCRLNDVVSSKAICNSASQYMSDRPGGVRPACGGYTHNLKAAGDLATNWTGVTVRGGFARFFRALGPTLAP